MVSNYGSNLLGNPLKSRGKRVKSQITNHLLSTLPPRDFPASPTLPWKSESEANTEVQRRDRRCHRSEILNAHLNTHREKGGVNMSSIRKRDRIYRSISRNEFNLQNSFGLAIPGCQWTSPGWSAPGRELASFFLGSVSFWSCFKGKPKGNH